MPTRERAALFGYRSQPGHLPGSSEHARRETRVARLKRLDSARP